MEELYHTTCNCSQFFRSEQFNGNAVSVNVDAYGTGQICAKYLYAAFFQPVECLFMRMTVEVVAAALDHGDLRMNCIKKGFA